MAKPTAIKIIDPEPRQIAYCGQSKNLLT